LAFAVFTLAPVLQPHIKRQTRLHKANVIFIAFLPKPVSFARKKRTQSIRNFAAGIAGNGRVIYIRDRVLSVNH
jgi:hypothetical protein